jgi:hypothetical protein
MSVRAYSRAFTGGELTPEFWGQLADAKFQAGLALCRNFRVLPHGPIENRPGTQFVRKAKLGDTGAAVRLIPFEFSSSQTLVLEFGAGYVRFHTMGATVEQTPGTPYEVTTPYAQADLFDLHFVQSADVLTIVHPSYPPQELRRLGATNWQLVGITFAPALAAPATIGGNATQASGPTNLRSYVYKVTALNADGDESYAPTASVTLTNNLLQTGAYNDITWSAVTGATRYRIYCQSNGLFGYLGETDGSAGLTFRDDNITPDISQTPPIGDTTLTGEGNYPGAVSYFEQRRVFAGTTNKPQRCWLTRSSTESNLTYSLPVRDDDRIAFTVASRQVNAIRHVVPLTSMVLLTSSAEWRVTSSDGSALTPSNPDIKPQSYIGANNVQPAIVGNNILFAAARGGHMRELAYNWQAQGYVTGDLSLRAPHLFDELEVVDLAYAKAPYPVLYCVSSNGKLLGLTYVPEQQIGAWHQHDTGDSDKFVSVCVVPEGKADAVYVAVQRTVGGSVKTYVERFASRKFTDLADAVFLDASLTYNGAAVSTVSGLGHLEGRTVGILADGAVCPQQVVTGGAITLDSPASKITVGLPYNADVQTLPLAFEAQAYGQWMVKNVNKVWLRVASSSALAAGPSFDRLTAYKQRTTEALGSPPTLVTGVEEIVLSPSWQAGGQVCVRQADPLPITLVSMTVEVALGG